MIIDFLLNQNCIVQPCIGSRDGTEVYGADQIRSCRLQNNRQLQTVGSVHGTADTAPSRTVMYCRGMDIPVRSLVICDGNTYVVSACRKLQGLGQEHLEVMLE